MMIRLVWLAFVALSLQAEDAADILARVKAATGGSQWDRVRTWHERGTFELDDLKGSYESWLDFHQQRSYDDVRISSPVLGSIRSTEGWNNRVSWSADQTGDVCVADSEEARNGAAGDVYIATFAFLFGRKFPAEMLVRPPRTEEGKRYQVVQVTPRGADAMELWIDETYKVSRVVELKGVEKASTFLSDYRPVSGLLVPFQSRKSNGEATLVTSVEINSPAPARIFDPPQPVLTGVQFPAGEDAVTVAFQFDDEQIHLPVSINGKPQEQFIFDTGATNTMDPAEALAMGLKVQRAGVTYGGGPAAAIAGKTRVDRIEIGALKMDNQIIDTTELPEPIKGAIGYELARRTVVTIDYAARRMTFTKPRAFRKPAHAIAMPFRFANPAQILVKGSVDGIAGEFQLDTGAGEWFSVLRPFAERHGLLAKYGSGQQVPAGGVGGVTQEILFHPAQFSIGKLTPWISEAGITLAESGGDSQEYVAGAIGNAVLRQFVLTLDYSHRMVYFEKNASYGQPGESPIETFQFRTARPTDQNPARDGWLGIDEMKRHRESPVEISELEADGPFAQAGILKGDLIMSLNGLSTEKLSGVDVAKILIAKPGTAIRLMIKRGSETREIVVETI